MVVVVDVDVDVDVVVVVVVVVDMDVDVDVATEVVGDIAIVVVELVLVDVGAANSVHCAWSTRSFAKSYKASSEYGLPPVPEEVVCHPLKVCPVRVNEFEVSCVGASEVCAGIVPIPPFARNSTDLPSTD